MISTIQTDEQRYIEFFGAKLHNVFYKDRYNLTEYDKILMPYELQDRVYKHLNSTQGKHNIARIKAMSHVETDNIGIDKKYYTQLRSMICET